MPTDEERQAAWFVLSKHLAARHSWRDIDQALDELTEIGWKPVRAGVVSRAEPEENPSLPEQKYDAGYLDGYNAGVAFRAEGDDNRILAMFFEGWFGWAKVQTIPAIAERHGTHTLASFAASWLDEESARPWTDWGTRQHIKDAREVLEALAVVPVSLPVEAETHEHEFNTTCSICGTDVHDA